MSEERVGDIVDLANAQKPDLTVLLGDYVCTHPFVSGYVPPGAWAEQLARLEAPLGVYVDSRQSRLVVGGHSDRSAGQFAERPPGAGERPAFRCSKINRCDCAGAAGRSG